MGRCVSLVIVVEIKGDDRGVMGAGVAAMRRGHRLCDSRDVRWAAITQCVEATRGEIDRRAERACEMEGASLTSLRSLEPWSKARPALSPPAQTAKVAQPLK